MNNPIDFRKYVAVAAVRNRYEHGRLTKGVCRYSLIPSGNSGRKGRVLEDILTKRGERETVKR